MALRYRRGNGAALIALGILIAISAIAGPLVLGVVRFHVSETADGQLVGGEVVSLLVVAPLAIVTGILWMRGSALAPSLALGPALYSLYMYVQYIIGPQYERYPGNNEYLFPVYLALIILSWSIALNAWRELAGMPVRALSPRMRRVLAVLLLVLSLTFALAWISTIIIVLAGRHTSTVWLEYEKDQTLFWVIRMMDLGFVIPASVVVATGLLRRAPWSATVTQAFLGFQTLIVAAVAGMATMMAVRSDPASNPVLLVMTLVFTIALGGAFVTVLKTADLSS